MTIKAIIFIFVATFLLLTPQIASSEWFGDVYLGWHNVRADDMKVKFNGTTVKSYPESDSGSIFGGRIGFWFENHAWLGWAVDASVSQIDFRKIDIGVGSASALLMVRVALNESEAFPQGRFQPYLGVGPGIFYGGMSEFIDEVPPAGAVLDDVYFSLGLDARAGITYLFNNSYGMFLEYAFKRFNPEFSSTVPAGTITLRPTFTANIFSVGITFRF